VDDQIYPILNQEIGRTEVDQKYCVFNLHYEGTAKTRT